MLLRNSVWTKLLTLSKLLGQPLAYSLDFSHMNVKTGNNGGHILEPGLPSPSEAGVGRCYISWQYAILLKHIICLFLWGEGNPDAVPMLTQQLAELLCIDSLVAVAEDREP